MRKASHLRHLITPSLHSSLKTGMSFQVNQE
jgi:hypothetical protein